MDTAPRNLFKSFHSLEQIPYTYIREQPVHVDVRLPETINADTAASLGPRPVLVNLHGGGLITGSRHFEPFWAKWIINEAATKNAILVAPDYPLAPESKSEEILASLHSFMQWLQSGGLQQELDSRLPGFKVEADLSKLLVVGESAGGWAALHVGLAYPVQVKALILRYPMVDLEADWYQKPSGAKEIFGQPLPGPELLDKHLAQLVPGQIVTEGVMDRFMLTFASILNGRLPDVIGRSEASYPLRGIRDGARLPPKVWVLHGTDDSFVPMAGAERAVALIKQHIPQTEVKFDTAPGNHGFDGTWSVEETPVLGERLAWLEGSWLG